MRIDAFDQSQILRERRVHVPAPEQSAALIHQLAAGGAGGQMAGEHDRRIALVAPVLNERRRDAGISRSAMRHHDSARRRLGIERRRLILLLSWRSLAAHGSTD
jgi:hypothetical protein